MPIPGDIGGDCPRCGQTMKLIGYGHSVHAAHCGRCNLTVSITGDAVAADRTDERDWNPDEWEQKGTSYGPDPWG